MTGETQTAPMQAAIAVTSPLPFDPRDLMKLRVLPAQFARMMGVSKQSVSKWIKHGKVTLGPDGKLDPAAATRDLIGKTEPTRMRARVIRAATQEYDELRQRIADLEAELTRVASVTAEAEGKAEAIEQAAVLRTEDDYASRINAFCAAIEDQFDLLASAHRAGKLGAVLDTLMARTVLGMPDYRNDEDDLSSLGEDAPDLGAPENFPA